LGHFPTGGKGFNPLRGPFSLVPRGKFPLKKGNFTPILTQATGYLITAPQFGRIGRRPNWSPPESCEFLAMENDIGLVTSLNWKIDLPPWQG